MPLANRFNSELRQLTDFKHTPPDARPLDTPLRSIVVNDEWAAHIEGLFGEATRESYWASDNEQARDDAIGVEQIIAFGDSMIFPVQHCHVRRTTNQSILDATTTTISFDLEIEDIGGLWDAGTPDRISLTELGVYIVGGQVRWATNAVGERLLIAVGSVTGGFLSESKIQGAFNLDHSIMGKVIVTTPENIRLKCFQSSGGALNIKPIGVRSIDLWVHYLGPLT